LTGPVLTGGSRLDVESIFRTTPGGLSFQSPFKSETKIANWRSRR
jgi:hypothetical protein